MGPRREKFEAATSDASRIPATYGGDGGCKPVDSSAASGGAFERAVRILSEQPHPRAGQHVPEPPANDP